MRVCVCVKGGGHALNFLDSMGVGFGEPAVFASVYMYIYICVCVFACACVYAHVFAEEREERESYCCLPKMDVDDKSGVTGPTIQS